MTALVTKGEGTARGKMLFHWAGHKRFAPACGAESRPCRMTPVGFVSCGPLPTGGSPQPDPEVLAGPSGVTACGALGRVRRTWRSGWRTYPGSLRSSGRTATARPGGSERGYAADGFPARTPGGAGHLGGCPGTLPGRVRSPSLLPELRALQRRPGLLTRYGGPGGPGLRGGSPGHDSPAAPPPPPSRSSPIPAQSPVFDPARPELVPEDDFDQSWGTGPPPRSGSAQRQVAFGDSLAVSPSQGRKPGRILPGRVVFFVGG